MTPISEGEESEYYFSVHINGEMRVGNPGLTLFSSSSLSDLERGMDWDGVPHTSPVPQEQHPFPKKQDGPHSPHANIMPCN